jgi:hypothetical protein
MKNKFSVFFIIFFVLCLAPGFLWTPADAGTTAAITGNVRLVVYDITVTGIDTSHATVSWKTNGNANSTVEYGPTTSYGSLSTNGIMTKDHTISLVNLLPGTVYHFQVISADPDGNHSVSADLTFTTNALPAPTTAPTPYYGGDDGGYGDDSGIIPTINLPLTLPQPTLPEQTPQPVCHEVSQNYFAGFVGMLYNADNKNTLDLDINKARAGGAAVTIDSDHIDVYQHDSTGVLFRFWLDTSDIRNTTRIVKHVNSAELWTDPLVANLTKGTFNGSIHAIPVRILEPSIIKITLSDCTISEITSEIRNVSAQNNLELGNIAYTMDVETFNLIEIGEANVTMTLPESWVDQQGGTDAVHIARIGDETGKTELLTTVFVGSDLQNLIFRGDSPYGPSLYAIFSATPTISQKQEPDHATVPVLSGVFLDPVLTGFILIMIIMVLVAIAAYFGWWRHKKT